ncbi:hypothetical protein Lepto7376_1853 [[Leptolyngbya] sp. PCC 7376]|uniref:hypothetical protein n=1 Tax=[Leptolyngbya] sp. PCC 7376 TaxID=111781 RepID=UPI00029EF8AA|nr:hypothetical protein [[Leptolyngbya] sp. PCC 7376]AFY38177.1 hypothetical protein Lepto7376_1853 [[Leptolyngbya] sp. PCC 7376]
MARRINSKKYRAAQKAKAEAEAKAKAERKYYQEINQKVCPNCGAQNTALILYGLMNFDESLKRNLANNWVVLGGCDLSETNPAYECNECHHTWK